MTAILRLPTEHSRPPVDTDPAMRALLNRIRFVAAACRVSARLDLHEAWRRLGEDCGQPEEAHVATLIRVMGQALGTRPVFRRPGEREMSFDESWLVAAIGARMAGDDESFAFLVTRRVAASKRRIFAMLVTGLAQRVAQIPPDMPFAENIEPAPSRAGLSL